MFWTTSHSPIFLGNNRQALDLCMSLPQVQTSPNEMDMRWVIHQWFCQTWGLTSTSSRFLCLFAFCSVRLFTTFVLAACQILDVLVYFYFQNLHEMSLDLKHKVETSCGKNKIPINYPYQYCITWAFTLQLVKHVEHMIWHIPINYRFSIIYPHRSPLHGIHLSPMDGSRPLQIHWDLVGRRSTYRPWVVKKGKKRIHEVICWRQRCWRSKVSRVLTFWYPHFFWFVDCFGSMTNFR